MHLKVAFDLQKTTSQTRNDGFPSSFKQNPAGPPFLKVFTSPDGLHFNFRSPFPASSRKVPTSSKKTADAVGVRRYTKHINNLWDDHWNDHAGSGVNPRDLKWLWNNDGFDHWGPSSIGLESVVYSVMWRKLLINKRCLRGKMNNVLFGLVWIHPKHRKKQKKRQKLCLGGLLGSSPVLTSPDNSVLFLCGFKQFKLYFH